MARRGYISNRDGEVRTGPHVDELLTKIEDLENATDRKDGTMSKEDKQKLDSAPIEPISGEWLVNNLV